MKTTIELSPSMALKTPQEVIAELQSRVPHLAEHATIEVGGQGKDPWVWLKLPKKPSAEDRAILGSGVWNEAAQKSDGSGIGFCWSKARASWYHPCETDRKPSSAAPTVSKSATVAKPATRPLPPINYASVFTS
jgi:hypothetical protein